MILLTSSSCLCFFLLSASHASYASLRHTIPALQPPPTTKYVATAAMTAAPATEKDHERVALEGKTASETRWTAPISSALRHPPLMPPVLLLMPKATRVALSAAPFRKGPENI
eukprot:CAMPEP_0172029072 /NCGR_PEP_ID=MMETSP1041-20130122/17933_1 /TAXON_ID=464988 /ORGANISM="Hemiselmis andersenii, Strain CCMP439" /LENGTH=112 /DNA_ID=CAMNT_0012685205 /DNA_START=343 /DNA_END=678 /DNA_ORIENTATION=-